MAEEEARGGSGGHGRPARRRGGPRECLGGHCTTFCECLLALAFAPCPLLPPALVGERCGGCAYVCFEPLLMLRRGVSADNVSRGAARTVSRLTFWIGALFQLYLLMRFLFSQ